MFDSTQHGLLRVLTDSNVILRNFFSCLQTLYMVLMLAFSRVANVAKYEAYQQSVV